MFSLIFCTNIRKSQTPSLPSFSIQNSADVLRRCANAFSRMFNTRVNHSSFNAKNGLSNPSCSDFLSMFFRERFSKLMMFWTKYALALSFNCLFTSSVIATTGRKIVAIWSQSVKKFNIISFSVIHFFNRITTRNYLYLKVFLAIFLNSTRYVRTARSRSAMVTPSVFKAPNCLAYILFTINFICDFINYHNNKIRVGAR